MSREILICALAALGCHALLLFGLRLENEAAPLPLAATEVEVSLVAAAPQSPASPAPEPPVVEATPPPTPVLEPVPEPRTPEPMIAPTPEPKPSAPETPQRITQRPAKSVTTQRTGRPSGTGRTAVSAVAGPGNTKPRYRSNPRPDYPSDARQQRQQGRVVLAVEVSAEGRPTNVSLQRSSGFPALDSAALAAVRRWTFEPARTAGVPVPARVEVPVQFDLSR